VNLNGRKYISDYLAAPPGSPASNDAASYGVTIREAQEAEGQRAWRVIGVHHLAPEENEGNLTILVEALDEEGVRIRQGRVWAASTFEHNADPPKVSALDKGDFDPMGCDFPMGKGATYAVWMVGDRPDANEPTDTVERLHTRHPDEGHGNTFGHHSFFVVFQRSLKGAAVLDEQAMLAAARRIRDEQIAGEEAFAVYARRHGLGAPITPEFSAGGFRALGYAGGIVYAPLARPDEIKHRAW
jgi:hypothetical protein